MSKVRFSQCKPRVCRGCGKRVGEEHAPHCICVEQPDYFKRRTA